MPSGRALQRSVIACLFVAVSVALGFATRIVARDKWYQNHAVYYQQVDAYFHGRLAIANDPSAVKMDMAWHDGGVQQIWGLGAPLLHLPSHLLAKVVFGGNPFPERLWFLLLLAGVGYGAYLTFEPMAGRARALVAGFALILFPPFVSLLRSRFQIWEEAVAYEYVVACYLLLVSASLVFRPTGAKFIAVCALAGFAPFVRPTAVFYSLSSVLVAFVVYKPTTIDRSKLIGLALGLLFASAMLVTNAIRFGAPLEFGHSIHTNIYNAIDYTTTFDNPFRAASFLAAIKDLVGSMLFTDIPSWKGFHAPNIFPWQSPIFRWREFYFRVFDLSFVLILGGGWGVGLVSWLRRATAATPSDRVIRALAASSVISFAGLFVFYLWIPGMSSRFLVDFAPAVAASFVGAMLFLAVEFDRRTGRSEKVALGGLLAAGCLWFVCEAVVVTRPGAQMTSATAKAVSLAEFKTMAAWPSTVAEIPEFYHLGADPRRSNIPFNGFGWDSVGGITAPYMIFYVTDPKTIRLVFSIDAGAPPSAYEPLVVKIGLEYLPRIGATLNDDLQTISFAAPKNPIYRKGVQMLAVRTVEAQSLANPPDLGLRLVEVRWDR